MVLLNPEQFAAEEQRKNNNCFLSSLQPFITTLFFHTQDAPRGFILLRDLGLLPTACSFPKCLGRISLLLLFLHGSLPTPRGRPLPCDNSLLATQSLLGKIKSTCKDEACQSFLHTRESIISFFFCEQICWLKNIKIKRWPSLQLNSRNIAKTPLMLWPSNDFQVTDLYLWTKQLISCYA